MVEVVMLVWVWSVALLVVRCTVWSLGISWFLVMVGLELTVVVVGGNSSVLLLVGCECLWWVRVALVVVAASGVGWFFSTAACGLVCCRTKLLPACRGGRCASTRSWP